MRFKLRHAQQTVVDHLRSRLDELGWFDDPPPWNTKPLIFREVLPDDIPSIQPNLVSVLIESASEDVEAELGASVGGLMSVTYELYVDVYGEKLSVTWSIAEDIKDALTHRTIPLRNYNTTPSVPTTGHIEFEAVRIVKPLGTVQAADVRKNWRSVVAEATLYFQHEAVA